MYEIKISVDAGLLDVEKDGVRVLRPNDDASLIELDAFLGVIQGSLDPDSGKNQVRTISFSKNLMSCLIMSSHTPQQSLCRLL